MILLKASKEKSLQSMSSALQTMNNIRPKLDKIASIKASLIFRIFEKIDIYIKKIMSNVLVYKFSAGI